jgi:excisionase family DNA binding protein
MDSLCDLTDTWRHFQHPGGSVMGDPAMLHVNEAAARLGVSPYTVRAWLRQRRIAHVRCGRRVLVPASAVERFIVANTVHPRERER